MQINNTDFRGGVDMVLSILRVLAIATIVIALLGLFAGIMVYLGIYPVISEELAKLPICSSDIQALAIIISIIIIVVSLKFILKRKQWALIFFVVGLVVIRSGFSYYMDKDHYVGKYYIYDHQSGQYSVLNRPLTDRLGRKYKPITMDVAVLITESKNRDLYPQEEIPFNKINAFFSESSGFPLIHYNQDRSGVYHFYHRHGFDALTGDQLMPVTAEIVKAGKIQAEQRLAQERAIRQAKEIEIEKARQLARTRVLAHQPADKKPETVVLAKPIEKIPITSVETGNPVSPDSPERYYGSHSLFYMLGINQLDLYDFGLKTAKIILWVCVGAILMFIILLIIAPSDNNNSTLKKIQVPIVQDKTIDESNKNIEVVDEVNVAHSDVSVLLVNAKNNKSEEIVVQEDKKTIINSEKICENPRKKIVRRSLKKKKKIPETVKINSFGLPIKPDWLNEGLVTNETKLLSAYWGLIESFVKRSWKVDTKKLVWEYDPPLTRNMFLILQTSYRVAGWSIKIKKNFLEPQQLIITKI